MSVEMSKFFQNFLRQGQVAIFLMSYLFLLYMWPTDCGLQRRQSFNIHCHDMPLKGCYSHLSIRQGTGVSSMYMTCADIAAHHRAVQLLSLSNLSSSTGAPPLEVVPPSVSLDVLFFLFIYFVLAFFSFLEFSWPMEGTESHSSAGDKRKNLVKNEEGKKYVKFTQAIFLTN